MIVTMQSIKLTPTVCCFATSLAHDRQGRRQTVMCTEGGGRSEDSLTVTRVQ